MSALSIGADAKTIKGESIGYLTGVQYLAPFTLAGIGNVCADSTPGCRAGCLFTAGHGVMPAVAAARIARTKAWRADRAAYMRGLSDEVSALARKARRAGLTPLVRLNGTSDIPWERVHAGACENIMAEFPAIQFYDYTKSVRRMRAWLRGEMPANYHLTFSRSECNEADAVALLSEGANVAVVFNTPKGAALPATWNGYQVIDGDLSDVRPGDPGAYSAANGAASMGARGVVVGLRAKGKARRDRSGFVVKVAA